MIPTLPFSQRQGLRNQLIFLCTVLLQTTFNPTLGAQSTELPPQHNPLLYAIIDSISEDRLEANIRDLVDFGTRNTLSDTSSDTRGIGAARRWIKAQFEKIDLQCGHCLDIFYQDTVVAAENNPRIPIDTRIVNVVAVQRGFMNSDKYILMSGDIDSRITDATNASDDAPGANDNATGMAGTIEAAAVLSRYKFAHNIVYVGLSGEEQGLFGGKALANWAKKQGWDIIGVLNNDMIGNIEGIDGSIDNKSFRIFSEPTPATSTEQQQIWHRFYGGEVDGPSRQLARYVDRISRQYLPDLKPMMIYRLDRFGRGGHHRPFNDLGYPGIRIMETYENYNRQHQDIRTENGIQYGDVIEGVNFPYVAKLASVNAITLAALAGAPTAPQNVMIGGAVSPSTTLQWDSSSESNLLGFKLYWRETTAPQWQFEKWVGKVNRYTLENIVIDNFLFGVSAVAKDGSESIIQFPNTLLPRRR